MNNTLLYIGGLFVMVLAVLFAVPLFVDWNGYRGVFEQEASRVIGRDVRVGGTVNVRFLPAPYVRFEKIRIADMDSSIGETLFRADSFKMWLSVPPLLRGIVQANEVELKRPVLRLAADATGTVNWSTLKLSAGALPFIPADVALESVRIINGVISLNAGQGQELARLEKIDGELTADAFDGPFKFKGNFKWDGEDREIRLATARPDAKGDVRFKTTVIATASQNSYVLDGHVTDLKSKPHIEGDLTSHILLPAAATAGMPAGSPAEKPAAPKDRKGEANRGPASFELRGKVTGDGTGFKLADIAISLEQDGPPQIITGEARMAWADKIRLDVGLGSRWLDLDRAAKGGGASPLEAARGLFEALAAFMPAEAETNASLRLDQVNLGAEAVSGVKLTMIRSGGPLELKEFRATVPGGGTLAVDGVLDVAGRVPKFEGSLSLSAQSTLRFLGWAFKHPRIAEGRTDAPLSLAGRLRLTDTAIELAEARTEIGTTALQGGIKLDLTQRRRLSVTLDGQKIDIGQFLPGSAGLAVLGVLKPPATAPAAANDGATPPEATATDGQTFDLTRSDVALRLKAGTLVDGERLLKNVDADLSIEDGRLLVTALKFATDDGLSVDAEGDAGDIRGRPAGTMRGLVSAASPAAARSFFRLLDLDSADPATESRFAEMAPLRLSGTVSFGKRTPTALDVRADGIVQGGRMVVDARLDGGRAAWHGAPADIVASLDGPNVARVASALLGREIETGSEGGPSAGRQELVVRAAGTPDSGLISLVALKGDGLSLDYTGRITLPSAGKSAANGLLRIAAADGRQALALAGVPLGRGVAGVALDGDLDITAAGDELTLKPRRLTVGGSAVAGVVTIKSIPAKPAVVTAELDVDSAALTRLLTPILAAAPARAGDVEATSAALTPGVWPDLAFDLTFLDKLQGSLKARFKSLAFVEGLTISGAQLAVVLEPGHVKVTELTGGALGGKLDAQLSFEKAPAGVGLDGTLRIGVGEAPAREPQTGSGEASASSSFDLKFSGRALSPAALMADLKGTGAVELGDVTLTGMGPGPVAATAEAALYNKGPSGGDALIQALKAGLKQGQLKLGAIKIPAVVGDGALKLEKVTIESQEGRSTFETAIELATLKIDSEWKIEAKVAPKPDAGAADKVMLPAISVGYTGKLSEFGGIEPAIEAGALERELTVRKMERDVDELERLRKLDQNKGATGPNATGASLVPPASNPGGEAALVTDGTAGATGAVPQPERADPPSLSQSPTILRRPKPAVAPKRPPAPSNNWQPFVTPF